MIKTVIVISRLRTPAKSMSKTQEKRVHEFLRVISKMGMAADLGLNELLKGKNEEMRKVRNLKICLLQPQHRGQRQK